MRRYLITIFLFMASMAADDSLVFMKEFNKQKQIVLAKANGKNQTLVTSGENWHLYPDLSSDGQNVVYMQSTGEYGFAILSTNLQSKSIRKWNKASGTHFHPRYSRNMRYLAFSQSQDYKNQIVIVDLLKAQDEGLWKRSDNNVMQYQGNYEVVKDRASCYFPHLSSDASFLVYHRTKADDGREVVFYDRAQKSKKIIAQGMAPSVSFDDRWIAYTAKQGENWNVWVYDRIKDKHLRVTENASNDYAPSFRADNSLYFASDRSGSLQIYTVSDWQAKNPKAELFISSEDATFYAPRFSGNAMYKHETFEPFPAPSRSSFGSTVHNGYIYVAGGHQGKEHTYPPESFSNQVHRYNIEKKTWEEVAPRKHKCHGFTLASHGKYVYAFGGFTYSPDYTPQWTSLDVIERYDTEKNVWEIVGRMPRKRSSNVAVKVQNKVYLIGGWDSTPKFEHDYDGKFHREIDIFDLESEVCYEADVLAPLPLRRAFTAVAHDDKIYLIGGLSIGTLQFNFLDKVTEFDIKNGSFKDMPPLPFATFAPAAQVIGDDLFVFGGMFEVGYFFEYEYACSIYKYNFNSRTWKNTGRFLTESKGFSQVVKHDDKLFILGGHSYHYNDNGLFLPDGIPNTFKKKSKDAQTNNERNNPVRTTEVFSIQK